MTSSTNRRRYPTRSQAKRKIIDQENEGKALEPPSKVRKTTIEVCIYFLKSLLHKFIDKQSEFSGDTVNFHDYESSSLMVSNYSVRSRIDMKIGTVES